MPLGWFHAERFSLPGRRRAGTRSGRQSLRRAKRLWQDQPSRGRVLPEPRPVLPQPSARCAHSPRPGRICTDRTKPGGTGPVGAGRAREPRPARNGTRGARSPPASRIWPNSSLPRSSIPRFTSCWKKARAAAAASSTGACSTWNLSFLPTWRRYHQALRQRNAALKQDGSDDDLAAWEQELAAHGEALVRQREAYLGPHCGAAGRNRRLPARSPDHADPPARLGFRPATAGCITRGSTPRPPVSRHPGSVRIGAMSPSRLMGARPRITFLADSKSWLRPG